MLEVAYRNKIIIFEPSFTSYKQEILSLVDMLKDAITKVPRIETVLMEKLGLPPLPREKVFLKASMPIVCNWRDVCAKHIAYLRLCRRSY